VILADTAPLFPRCPTFGFTMQPDYLVKITQREGGFERRDRKWARPLHQYSTVPMVQQQADIEAVLNFWHVVGGRSTGFRFKDWADFTSGSIDNTPTALDQPFTFIPGSPGGYQMTKRYQVGSMVLDRFIYRPVGSTIRVANDAGVEQAASRWTVDESSGYLTPGAGFVGTPGTWGGEFTVYVRFNSDLQIQITDFKIQSVNFALQELRPNP